VEGDPKAGDEVAVYGGDDGRFIAYGLLNGRSDLRIRLYSWKKDERIDGAFLARRIASAVSLRRETLGLWTPDGACRAIFSEADGLSGLVVDRYGPFLVIQVTSVGIARRLMTVVEALSLHASPEGILLRDAHDVQKKEGVDLAPGVLAGNVPEEPVRIRENGLVFRVSLREGQKTGLFLDQRENRAAVSAFAAGGRVLDLFCYTGGFGLHCAKAGAKEVVGVDSSAAAVAEARENAAENGLTGIRFEVSDALEFLAGAGEAEPFDLVILDPPRFVASHDSKEYALKKYYRLNLEALQRLRPGGILVSSSCSGRITAHEWIRLLSSVGARSGRHLKILAQRGAAPDHPVSPHCPETGYLKCVIAQVA
jgi:23S rRNA (cytosine1962-C5)-methyltransferase